MYWNNSLSNNKRSFLKLIKLVATAESYTLTKNDSRTTLITKCNLFDNYGHGYVVITRICTMSGLMDASDICCRSSPSWSCDSGSANHKGFPRVIQIGEETTSLVGVQKAREYGPSK